MTQELKNPYKILATLLDWLICFRLAVDCKKCILRLLSKEAPYNKIRDIRLGTNNELPIGTARIPNEKKTR